MTTEAGKEDTAHEGALAEVGPPPDPARWRGDHQEDALLTEGNPENMADGQTAPGFEPDGLTEEEMAVRDARAGSPAPLTEDFEDATAAAAEAFPPVEDEAVEHAAAEFAALSAGPLTFPDRAGMPDGVTRTAAFVEDDEQGSYLPPDVPDGHLAPPLADVFANETWRIAEEQFSAIVRDVLDFDEFKHLEGLTHLTVWHRQGKPKHAWADLDGERTPMLAQVKIMSQFERWVTGAREVPDALPDYVVALYYQHFHDLREEGMFYHREQIAMQVHIALSMLSTDSGILGKRPPSVVVQSKETLARYGYFSQGLRSLQKPMLALMKQDILQTPGFE